MKTKSPNLVILLDEGTPIQAAEPFLTQGHQVIFHGDALSPGAKDEQVAAVAILNNAILIALDRDMRQMAKRFGNATSGGKFTKLNLIFLNCNPVLGPKRLEQFVSYIEHEWRIVSQKAARNLWIDIGPHYIRSYR